MKRFGNILINHLLLLCSIAIIFSLGSCNQKKEKSEETVYEGKNPDDTLVQQAIKDTQTTSTQPVEPTAKKETAPPIPLKPKLCDPNFKLLASPKKSQKIYYVSGFNPGEFKCWIELENFGQKLCGSNPCFIYYVDIANVLITSTPPHFVDEVDLKTHGIGWFKYNGKNWTIQGSTVWGRKEKGYAYYNTDNAGGG